MSTLRFILLEDNPVDAELVQAMLLDGKIDHELQRVDTGADFQTALLSDEFDLILADYALADFDGINALEIARRLRPDTPFIFISGSLGEELAIAAIKQGATDYVLKQRLGRLVPSVQQALQEVPEDKDTIDRKQALSAIESDLKDTQLLHELSARLVIEGDIQTLYQEIVAAAIALTRADAGSIQILDEATQELVMLANQGTGQKLTEHFYRVNASSNTPCGIALTTGKRTFVDFDVPESEDPHGSMRLHREEGYLSAQSTPLITRSGKAIGMFSTHWCKHHRPSDREVRFLDLLARQAADLIEQRQAQVALRESEAKYRSLFESMNEGLAINELVRDESGRAVDARYLELNPAYERQTGFDRSSTLGRLASEVFPNYYRSWLEIVERVVRTGQPERFEHFVPDNDKWFVFQVTPFGGADSFSVLYDDITDRKRREANLVFLASIENEFANLTLSSEIANVAGDRIAAHFNLSHCLLVEIDEQETVARVFHDHKAADLPSLVGDYVIQDFHTQAEAEQLAAGQPLVINDALSERHSEENAARFEALGNRSLVTAPYVRDGRWKFALSAQDREPRLWREDEIKFLQELAMRVSLRIERARAEVALRESEEKYRSLFTTMEQGFCIIEKVEMAAGQPSDFRYLTANPAFEHHTGMHDVVGKTIRELVPDAEEPIMDIYDEMVRTGQPQQFENYVTALNLWMEAEVFPAMPGQIAVLFSNVSERKRAEAQLRRAAQMDAFRVKLSDALRSLADPVEIQAVASRLLGEHLSANQVHYGKTIGDYVVIQQGYGNGLPPMVGNFRFIDFGERLIADYQAGRTTVSCDVLNDPNITEAERRVIAGAGFQAYIAVPLTKAEGWVATLAVHSIAPRDWTTHEVELVQETAERTWATIERARAEAALRESEIQRIREQAAREEERQRAESLAELDRAKTLFFSNVSHEFRTPLTLSLAPLQDALSDSVNPLTSSQRERLELAHRNSLRLLKLVNTLLDFSRIEADRLKANYEPTDLSSYTAELASVFRSAIENANLQLVVDCPPLPDPIYVDREMWEKIVLNLLSNALKFTFEGMISISLKPVQEGAGSREQGELSLTKVQNFNF